MEVLAQAADGADGEEDLDAEGLEGVDVGADVEVGRGRAVAAPVSRQKRDPSAFEGAECLTSEHCCDAIQTGNRSCYRAQCMATARGLVERLRLPGDRWSVSFQSRLGRDPWIRPYTDEVLVQLAQRGVGRLVVSCPGFVADCLETVEEMGIRGRQSFLDAGGTSYELVPCLNARSTWVTAAAEMVRAVAGSTV